MEQSFPVADAAAEIASIPPIFREADGSVVGPFIPQNYGFLDPENLADVLEVAALLRSVSNAGPRFRLLCLGAAPGEWAARAERAYKRLQPAGDYMSVNVEADVQHVRMMDDFFRNNAISPRRNAIIYGAVGSENGWAYFPVVIENHWGCGIAAFSGDASQLDDNIHLSENSRKGIIATSASPDIEFRSVLTLSLSWLLDLTGPVDFLHCDIQGSEGSLFPAHVRRLTQSVGTCCISIHGTEIDSALLEAFRRSGAWTLERYVEGHYVAGPQGEECHKDGVQIWSNNQFSLQRQRF